jgi:hypothetical protein
MVGVTHAEFRIENLQENRATGGSRCGLIMLGELCTNGT